MTCKRRLNTGAAGSRPLAACGNYSNEDLEFMNAVPAREDIAADIPRALLMPANEAELSKLTHDVDRVVQRRARLPRGCRSDPHVSSRPAASRTGASGDPIAMDDHPGWQWRFIVTRDPAAPEMFSYAFEVQPIGGGRRLDPVHRRLRSWPRAASARAWATSTWGPTPCAPRSSRSRQRQGRALKDLDVMYWTAAFPVSVTMTLDLYPARRLRFRTTTHHRLPPRGAGERRGR